MKKISITLGLMICLAITQASAQLTVSGITLPATMKAGNNNLVLNGGGVRVKMFIDVYVAGLYTQAKSNNGDAIAKANEPTAVTIHITSSLATSERMKDAIIEGFKKSTGDKTAPLQPKIDKFLTVLTQAPMVKGDVLDNVYIPGEGTKVYKNGKLIETIDGLDFKTALWGIWLGGEPADKGLKAGMLGVAK
jgi:hypothetical protein